jgi:DNA-binding transcriptional regulator GbsR (MarR family)
LKGYLDAGQLVEILDEYNSLLDRDRLAKKVCDYTKGKASQMFSNGQYEKTQTLIDVTKNQISRISPQYAKQNVFRDLEAKILDIKRTNQNKLERKRADARLNKLIRSFM